MSAPPSEVNDGQLMSAWTSTLSPVPSKVAELIVRTEDVGSVAIPLASSSTWLTRDGQPNVVVSPLGGHSSATAETTAVPSSNWPPATTTVIVRRSLLQKF